MQKFAIPSRRFITLPSAVSICCVLLLAFSGRAARAQATGTVDGIDGNGVVWGWAADYTNPMVPISVHFYVDQLDQAHYAGRVDAYEKYNRPDVWDFFNWGAANHGFAFTIPNSSPNDPSVSFNLRNGASHQVYAFGIALNGTSVLLGNWPTPLLPNLPSSLTQPLSVDGKFSIIPNQLAGNLRYRPPPETGSVVNGHIEGSFDNFGYWPSLNSKLRQINGGFGTFAPEIGYMHSSTLQKFRNAGIPFNVEMPACGICIDGDALARAEFNGQAPYTEFWIHYFFENYYIGDRRHPNGVGWFRTRDDLPYTPDEVALDHRLDSLMQHFNVSIIMDTSNPNGIQDPAAEWQDRKNRARVDNCPQAATFNPGVDRITGLVNDYVEYARVMKAHFAPGPSPRFSFHWPSSPGMEWSNEAWLDQTFAANPNPAAFVHAIQYVLNPQHKDTEYLARVVDALCASGTCPDTVYMDTDFTYLTNYTIADLRRKKAMLEARNVKMGIDLVDTCSDQDRAAALPGGQDCVTVLSGDGNWLYKETRPLSQYTSNALYEQSVLAVTNFLRIQGIIDANTKVRLESWYRRPIESGSGIHENNVGSFAHTANRVFTEYLQPGGWDRSWHKNGLVATLFDNSDLTGASVTRRDPRVSFEWGAGSPDPFIGPDHFSARWEGQVWAGYSETYTFYTNTDDGARLWVNGQLIINDWGGGHPPQEHSGTIFLERGKKYNIKLEYFELGGGATVHLLWSSASQPKEVIPESRLFTGDGVLFSFDEDRRTDLAVWRPANGNWYVSQSSNGAETLEQWGQSGDLPVPADYDGDGTTDIAVWRPSSGMWYIVYSSGGAVIQQQWGLSQDLPVPADYDGDGRADIAVWRPSDATWYIRLSASGGVLSQQWGYGNDKPVPADYDGDGKTDITVWRPSEGNWYSRKTTLNGGYTVEEWGGPGDKPVPADYDGDRKADKAVWRPSNAHWYTNNSTGGSTTHQLGIGSDVPVPGNYDGDRKVDVGVWRSSDGSWRIKSTQTGTIRYEQYGGNGDIAAPSAFIR